MLIGLDIWLPLNTRQFELFRFKVHQLTLKNWPTQMSDGELQMLRGTNQIYGPEAGLS
jgi:hypothetical protein